MEWKHSVSLDWMKARQKYLTASEVKNLIPFTKTGRSRKIEQEDYLKVYANKLKELTEADCLSFGAAARGHILEPYAIKMFNEAVGAKFFHWDDAIIHDSINSILAFSPDGLNIPQPNSKIDFGDVFLNSTMTFDEMIEVKCYSAERHLIAKYIDKMNLEERWQIAHAFTTSSYLKQAYLVFFNPSMKDYLIWHRYTRDDLKEEIKVIVNVERNWLDFKTELSSGKLYVPSTFLLTDEPFEDKIIAEIEEQMKLNP